MTDNNKAKCQMKGIGNTRERIFKNTDLMMMRLRGVEYKRELKKLLQKKLEGIDR
jgi:hypothetical protein